MNSSHLDSDSSDNEDIYEGVSHVDEKLDMKLGLPDLPQPEYFEKLSPADIYDSFFTIRRMGFIANRIIRRLNETKHIVSSKILEKRKKLKAVQRKQFENLTSEGVEYLRVLLKSEISSTKNGTSDVPNTFSSPSLKCRVAHLTEDTDAIAYLSVIYKTEPTPGKLETWTLLADRFINNENWRPAKAVINDDRVADVDPTSRPPENITGDILRSIFTRTRIEFTRTLMKFHSSVKMGSSKDVLDTDFWERFAKHDKAIYYIYRMVTDKQLMDNYIIDSVLSRADLTDADNGSMSVPGNGQKAMKREREGAGLDEVDGAMHLELLESNSMAGDVRRRDEYLASMGVPHGVPEDSAAWKASAAKDRAVANYYRRLAINNDIRFHIDMLNRENVGEAVKRNIKAKMTVLLMKKVEDRYDDL